MISNAECVEQFEQNITDTIYKDSIIGLVSKALPNGLGPGIQCSRGTIVFGSNRS